MNLEPKRANALLATGCSLRLLTVLAHRHTAAVLAVLAVLASILAVLAVAAGHVLAIGHFIPILAIFICWLWKPDPLKGRHLQPVDAPDVQQNVLAHQE